jgi:signal transduction histidine kinase
MRWRIRRALTPMEKFSLVTFVSVLVVTAVACALGGWLLVRHLVAHDAALAGDLARLLLTRSLPASLFFPTAVADPSLYARTMNDIAASDDVVRVILYDAQARVLWSDDTALIGRRFSHDRELRTALGGEIEAKIIRPGKEEHEGLRSFARIEEIYLPVRYSKDGPVVAVLEIYRYPPAFFAVVDRALTAIWLLGGGGGFVLYATLFAMARLGLVEVGPSVEVVGLERSAERRRSEDALRRMNETLEEETKRLAHEVHDEAGQLIASAQLALADVAHDMPASSRDGVARVGRVLDEVADQLRRLAHELRPTVLDDLGLVPALEFLAQGVRKRTALDVRVEGSTNRRLAPVVETTLYRVVQEAIINVGKHAHARSVIIRVDHEPGHVRCSIRDDGVGFNAVVQPKGPRGLGLLGIAHRVDAVGGRLEIRTQPGQGTTLIVGIPVPERPA